MDRRNRKWNNYRENIPQKPGMKTNAPPYFVSNKRSVRETKSSISSILNKSRSGRLHVSAAGPAVDKLVELIRLFKNVYKVKKMNTFLLRKSGTPTLEVLFERETSSEEKKTNKKEREGEKDDNKKVKKHQKNNKSKESMKEENKKEAVNKTKQDDEVAGKKEEVEELTQKNVEEIITKKIEEEEKEKERKEKKKMQEEEKKEEDDEGKKKKTDEDEKNIKDEKNDNDTEEEVVKKRKKFPLTFGSVNAKKFGEEQTIKLLSQIDFFLFALQNFNRDFKSDEYNVFKEEDLTLIISKSAEVTKIEDEIKKDCQHTQLYKVKFENYEFQVLHTHKFDRLKTFKMNKIIQFGEKQKMPTLIFADFGEVMYKSKKQRNYKYRPTYFVKYTNRISTVFQSKNVVSLPCPERCAKPTEHVFYFGYGRLKFQNFYVVRVEKLNEDENNVAYLFECNSK